MLEKIFKLKERNATVKKEIIGGLTTFLTMAYILGVNPGMLSEAGMPFQSVFLATALSSAIACIIMGVFANYPVALSAGMGVNAFFTYSVCLQMGFTYPEALAAVFVSGVIFLVISVTGIRKTVINSIPKNLKLAIGAGIGFFIAFIGLTNAGIIVSDPATKVALGDFTNPTVALALFGVLLIVLLMCRKVEAATFYGMLATAILGLVLGFVGVSGMPAMPTSVMSVDFTFTTVGEFVGGFKTLFTRPESFMIIFTFLFIDFFDTAGTLVAVGNDVGMVDEHGDMDNIDKALFADSVGTLVGASLGTSTITSFVESGAGVAAGGKTGLTAVVTGVLFFASIFFMPLLSVVNSIPVGDAFLSPITSPALITVGFLMITQLKSIDWDDTAVSSSAFITIIIMVTSYSIANGIACGFLVYTVAMIASNRIKQVRPITYVLDALFLMHFIL